MRSFSKSTLVTIVKFTIPAAIIGYLVWRIEPEQWNQLSVQPKNYSLLLAALLVALTAMSLSFARWCLLVRCQGIELTMLEAFRLGSIGFLLSFVSAGSVGGDLFKAIFLAKRRPGKRIAAVASVLVDRGCGLYGLLLLVTLALLLTNPTETGVASIGLEQIKFATAAFFGLGTVVLAILVLGGRAVDKLITWGSGLPIVGGLVATIGPPLRMFHSHSIAFGASILMSLGVQSMLVISMYSDRSRPLRRSSKFGRALCDCPDRYARVGVADHTGRDRATGGSDGQVVRRHPGRPDRGLRHTRRPRLRNRESGDGSPGHDLLLDGE